MTVASRRAAFGGFGRLEQPRLSGANWLCWTQWSGWTARERSLGRRWRVIRGVWGEAPPDAQARERAGARGYTDLAITNVVEGEEVRLEMFELNDSWRAAAGKAAAGRGAAEQAAAAE